MNKKFAYGIAVFLTVVLPMTVKADGMVIYPPNKPVYETGQKAVIWHDGKRETLIVSTTFRGNAADFAWVIPVPARPEVGQAKDELFTALQDYTMPKYTTQRMGVGMLGSVNYDTAVKAPSVTVIETKKIDIYDVTVLEATNGKALREWLTKNGYEYPTNRDLLLQYYVDKKWYFVAAKVTTEALGYAGSSLREGHATPISISFDWPTIIYPMKISGAGSKYNEADKVAAFGFETSGSQSWYGGTSTTEESWQGDRSYRVNVQSRVAVEPTQNTYAGQTTMYSPATYTAGRNITGLKSGEKYVLSAYVKTSGEVSGSLKMRVFNGYDYDETEVGDFKTVREWKRFTVPFTVSNENSINFYLNAEADSGKGMVYWDGIQVEKGSTPTAFTEEVLPETIAGGTTYANQNMNVLLYVFANHKKMLPGFNVEYAGDIPAKDIDKLAVDDEGKPWIKNNKKMYLTKLTKSMTQSQMTDDLVIRDADNNDAVGGVHESDIGYLRPILVIGLLVGAEVAFMVYIKRRNKK